MGEALLGSSDTQVCAVQRPLQAVVCNLTKSCSISANPSSSILISPHNHVAMYFSSSATTGFYLA